MTIEFAKSDVTLDETMMFIQIDRENEYAIVSKDHIMKTKDIKLINSFGYDTDISQEEIDTVYKNGYDYLSYWDGHNMQKIDLENDFHSPYSLDVNNLELIDQKNYEDQRYAEYALIREKTTDVLYIVVGTSSYIGDVFATLIPIKDASEYYDIINN